MTAAKQPTLPAPSVYDRYQDNLPRHILGVANYLQTRMMAILREDYGHANLRLSFAPYITLAGEAQLRVSELADILGISRQACNQGAQQVENAGYLQRIADPLDGRAKQLRLTARGQQLRRDGIRAVATLDQQFAATVGEAQVRAASQTLGKIYTALQLSVFASTEAEPAYTTMGGLLPRLADYILLRLMELTRARGHPGLKLSFGQVLPFIGTGGGRIQHIAALHDVSKQAISAIATELESLGYLRREAHPTDARQIVLQFTPRGEALIADSVQSTDELAAEFAAITGLAGLTALKRTLKALYEGLQLDQSLQHNRLVPPTESTDLRLLARQLHTQLGEQGCRELAALLNTAPGTRGKRKR